ncbi:MAG: ATP-binding protein [Candidatus Omnitrophica bacterium]|nr:ATP-binding protein [Candidatus Omnitrophota bacterium]
MIPRSISAELQESAREYPVVTLHGPRQSGKTTLVRMIFPDKPYFSLEDPDIHMAAEEDPRGFLARMEDGGILDEIQRLPILLSYIQGIVDEKNRPGMFVLTGSHQPRLQEAISQTLAGRTAILTLLPFSLEELRNYPKEWNPYDLIVRGFFPRVHEQGLKAGRFYSGYLQTYVERDVRAMIQLKDLNIFQQFLKLIAGRVGQTVNYTSLSNDVGVSGTTIKNWISVLKASYVLYELPPYFENIRKRVVKSPKIYFTDIGLIAYLLGIETPEQAERDPLRGGLYENLVIMEILKVLTNRGQRPDLHFYRDAQGIEVDLIVNEDRTLYPIEIKSAKTFTPGIAKGIERFKSLLPDRVGNGTVFYDGDRDFDFKGNRVRNPLRVEDPYGVITGG